MLQENKEIYGYISTEYIKDMGAPARLEKVERDIKSGKVDSLKFNTKKRALFLDRDGVINKEVNHLSKPEQFELISGVANAIRKVNSAGILVVVITNQPVIARGELAEDGLRLIHNKMDTLLGEDGAYIDRVYYCPHHPDKGFNGEVEELKIECTCRKPNAGLFEKAVEELNIDLDKSWMVGDRTADILAANRLQLRSILVNTGYAGNDCKYTAKPDFVVDNIESAVYLMLENC